MRWADLIAFATTCLWLGGNVALAISAWTVFPQAKMGILDANLDEVGEIFGQIFLRWIWVSLIFAAVFLLARLVGWTLRLRHGRMRPASWASVAIGVAVVALTAASVHTTLAAGDAFRRRESAEDDEAAFALANRDFQLLHDRSTNLSKYLTLALAAAALGLGCSLGRRNDPEVPSSSPITA